MTTILLDCDGVVLDLASTLHKFVQRMLSRKVPPPTSWKTYDFQDAMELTKSEWQFVHKMIERKDRLGYLVGYYPQAQAFIEHLSFTSKVVFVTSPWRGLDHWVEARLGLLDTYLSRRNFSIVFTADKDVVSGAWLVDDKWDHLENIPERGILFARPWNEKYEPWAHYVARDYAGVIEIIETPVESPDVVSTPAITPACTNAPPSKNASADATAPLTASGATTTEAKGTKRARTKQTGKQRSTRRDR
jgi:5'(3')-deoxyribonucleotidase